MANQIKHTIVSAAGVRRVRGEGEAAGEHGPRHRRRGRHRLERRGIRNLHLMRVESAARRGGGHGQPEQVTRLRARTAPGPASAAAVADHVHDFVRIH